MSNAGEMVQSSPSVRDRATRWFEIDGIVFYPSFSPLDWSSPTRLEGGLFPSLKIQTKKSKFDNARDDERKRDEVDEAVDVRREQEQVCKILVSAAALQAVTIQSEWNEDDNDFSDVDSNEDGQDQDCQQGPVLGMQQPTFAGQRQESLP